jgi:CxxC-x17-CxxC domain-containing protein
MPEYTDQQRSCCDCGNPFTFSAQLQQLYAERDYSHPPSRCSVCHEKRKTSQSGHEIRCSRCGKTDSVNFVPSGKRPVLCGACFRGGQ